MLTVRADTLTFTLPQSWDEVTLGQFLKLYPSADLRQTLLVLSGKSIADFRTLRAPDLQSVLGEHLQFLSALPDFENLPVARALYVAGQRVGIPQNLSAETTIGQWWDVEHVIRGLPEGQDAGLMELVETLLSVFLCPLLTGQPYDGLEQAATVQPALHALPCTDALPVAAFFLRSYSKPLPSGKITLRLAKYMTPTRWSDWRATARKVLTSLIPTSR